MNNQLPIFQELRDLAMRWRRGSYWWWNFARGLTAACFVLAVVSLFSRATIWQLIAFGVGLLLADRATTSWCNAWFAFRLELFERSEGAALELIESIKRRGGPAPPSFDLKEETQKEFARILAHGKHHQARGACLILLALAVLGYGIYVMPEKLWLIPAAIVGIAWSRLKLSKVDLDQDVRL